MARSFKGVDCGIAAHKADNGTLYRTLQSAARHDQGFYAPLQPAIALLPGSDVVAEAVIPLAGCITGEATSTYLGVNLLSP